MKSITGVEINNPEVCIKGLGTTFACVCPDCMKDSEKRGEEFLRLLNEKPMKQTKHTPIFEYDEYKHDPIFDFDWKTDGLLLLSILGINIFVFVVVFTLIVLAV